MRRNYSAGSVLLFLGLAAFDSGQAAAQDGCPVRYTSVGYTFYGPCYEITEGRRGEMEMEMDSYFGPQMINPYTPSDPEWVIWTACEEAREEARDWILFGMIWDFALGATPQGISFNASADWDGEQGVVRSDRIGVDLAKDIMHEAFHMWLGPGYSEAYVEGRMQECYEMSNQ
jgi:hypothetical protein